MLGVDWCRLGGWAAALAFCVAAWAAVIGAVVFVFGASPAGAETDRELGAFDVAAGELCTVDAYNGESVWPGNELIIVNGDEVIVTPAVEDAPDTDTLVSFVAAGDTVTVSVRFDVWSSLEATVACEPLPTTTTTTPPPDTTASTPPPTTPTTPPTTPPTTTPPPTPTTSTTEPPPDTTTTTTPDHDTTTTTERPCSVPDECLPDTGAETPLVVAVGLLSVTLGGIVLTVRELLT